MLELCDGESLLRILSSMKNIKKKLAKTRSISMLENIEEVDFQSLKRRSLYDNLLHNKNNQKIHLDIVSKSKYIIEISNLEKIKFSNFKIQKIL